MKTTRPRQAVVLLGVTVAAALMLSACSSDTVKVVGDKSAVSQTGAADKTLDPNPPTTWPGPDKSAPAQKGKSVTVVTCTSASPAVQDMAAGVSDAAKSLGWDVTVVDGKSSTTVQTSAIEGAITAKTNGIITMCIEPSTIPTALQSAKKAGIPVISASSSIEDTPLIAGYSAYPMVGYGKLAADWIIKDSGGKAKVVVIDTPNLPELHLTQSTVVDEIKKCKDCTLLEDAQISFADSLSPKMGSLISSLNQRYQSNMEYVVLPYGGAWGQAGPAIRALGRKDLKVVAYDGDSLLTQGCKEGLVQAAPAFNLPWLGWAAADQLNRVFAGQKPLTDTTVPAFLMTQANCQDVPDASSLVKLDYASQYKKLWGVD